MKIYSNVLEMVGGTPMLELKHLDAGPCRLFLKLELMNPGGSIKDRIGISMIEEAEKRGDLKPGADTVSMESVLDAVQRYGDNPSGFLAVNSGNSYFTVPGVEGVVVYRTSGRYLVQFAGPFAPAESYPVLLRHFVEFAQRGDKEIVAIELLRADAEHYAANGFTVNQVGASYSVDLSRFRLDGTAFMQLRNKISRAARNGLTVTEVDATE